MNWITENRRNLPIVVILTLTGLLLASGEDRWRVLLRYDREALAAGEWWRWITAHGVHAGWSHTFLNLAGLWVVWLLFMQRLGGWRGLFILVVSVLVMDAGFWFRDTHLGWYVGMSGLLHGLFVAGAWDELWRGVRGGGLLMAAVVAKLIYEQSAGPLPFSAETSGGPVWVNSHLYGATGGLIASTLLNARTAFKPVFLRGFRNTGDR